MTSPKIGATNWRQATNQARRANQKARNALGRILEERPGPERMALLIALVAQGLSENLEAIQKLEEIGRGAK